MQKRPGTGIQWSLEPVFFFFYRKVDLSMPSSLKVFRQSGVEAKSKAVSMAANSESSGVSEAGCSVLTFLCII